jgi:hypothetical protein
VSEYPPGSINTLFWLGFPQSKLVSSVPGCSTGLGGSINTPHPAILFVFVVLNAMQRPYSTRVSYWLSASILLDTGDGA